jgi:hypothetical protein
VWMVFAAAMPEHFHKTRMIVAGSAFATSGIPIVATHWGHFG